MPALYWLVQFLVERRWDEKENLVQRSLLACFIFAFAWLPIFRERGFTGSRGYESLFMGGDTLESASGRWWTFDVYSIFQIKAQLKTL